MPDELVRCPNYGRKNRVPAVASGTPRCGNCHRPLPWIVDATDDTFADLAEKVNVDSSPRLQQRFGVQAIPTLLILRIRSPRSGRAPRRRPTCGPGLSTRYRPDAGPRSHRGR